MHISTCKQNSGLAVANTAVLTIHNVFAVKIIFLTIVNAAFVFYHSNTYTAVILACQKIVFSQWISAFVIKTKSLS